MTDSCPYIPVPFSKYLKHDISMHTVKNVTLHQVDLSMQHRSNMKRKINTDLNQKVKSNYCKMCLLYRDARILLATK